MICETISRAFSLSSVGTIHRFLHQNGLATGYPTQAIGPMGLVIVR